MRRLAISGLLLTITALVGGTTTPAIARPPGINGQIAFDRIDPLSGVQSAFTANPDGTSATLVVPNTSGPDFSPDGSKLAIPYQLNDGRIGCATVNADGTGYTPFPIADPTLNVGCGTGSWSPDGKRLALETWDDSNPTRNGVYTISSADGSDLTRVTANPLGGHDVPGSYSPDGKRIVFIRYDADGHPAGLFVVKTDNGKPRQILPSSFDLNMGVQSDWSPQGNEIILSLHATPDVFGSIWVIHADGTGLHEIRIQGVDCGASFSDPHGVGCHGVRWSPDGKKIIFVAGTFATGTNIYTANADGSGLTQVSFGGADDDPAWGTHPLAG